MKKRILSCLMALALCLTLLPTAALAEETEGTAQTPPAVEEAADPANGEVKQENQSAAPEQEKQPAEQEEQREDSASKQDEDVANLQAMIDALPDAEALDGMNDEDAMAVYEAFQTVCEAYYETLNEEQQAQLKNTEKLEALSKWFSQSAALAEGTEHTDHSICGETGCTDSSHALLSGETWQGVSSLTEIKGAGHYFLTQNVTIDSTWEPESGVVLCLNGCSITANGEFNAITIQDGRTFTLCDCKGSGSTGKVTHSSGTGSGVYVNGTFNLYGGSITGNNSSYKGGGVTVWGGTFHMYGGTISDNNGADGGGVYLNSKINSGMTYKASFNMYGGTISGNTANYGGGVYVNSSTFTMTGSACIANNKATTGNSSCGGGVYVWTDANFDMNGGTISGNSGVNGGGVYVGNSARKFTMSNGTITQNTAKYGGGVWTGSSFTVSGDVKITDNTLNTGNTPDNVYLSLTQITIGEKGLKPEARIGVTKDGIKTGESATVATGEKDSCTVNNFFADKDEPYGIQVEQGTGTGTVVKLYNGLPHKHPICGAEHKDIGDHTTDACVDVNWEPWDGTGEITYDSNTNTAHVYLTANVVLASALTVKDGCKLYLCLNGKSITKTTSGSVIEVASRATLSLCDCKDVGKDGGEDGGKLTHSASTSGKAGHGVNLGASATFNMYGGSIADNKAGTGGGVELDRGNNNSKFNMYGGSITNNVANNGDGGGGVHILAGTFTMYGGSITGNKANTNYGGGGVYLGNTVGKFVMKGGSITDNTAKNGGGVYVHVEANGFTVSGNVTISGNKNTTMEDENVYLASDKTIEVAGALDKNAKIGVTTESTIADKNYLAIAEGNQSYDSKYTLKADDLNAFTSDNNTYGKQLLGNSVVFTKGELHTHTVCGKTDCKEHPDSVIWKGVSSLDEITGKGYYYLTQNVELTDQSWTVPAGDVVLCLNGYSITGPATQTVITVNSRVTFTLTDCNSRNTGNGTVTHNENDKGRGVYVNGGTFKMYGGSITGNKVTDNNSYGGGVYVSSGTFDMEGGTIGGTGGAANTAVNGGGVCVSNRGQFTMSGSASITGNTATNDGGGVAVMNGGQFDMSGSAVISGNKANNATTNGRGGGVYVYGEETIGSTVYKGTFNMYGGSITGNTAKKGGGVYVGQKGTFTMESGTIGGRTGNTATEGGGVCVSGGTFTMNNGSITGNKASRCGGGVCVGNSGQFTMTDGSITGNKADGSGGGVFVEENATFTMTGGTMTGGTISGNTASNFGGGVYVKSNTFTVSGPVKITDNCKGGTLDSGTGKYTGGTKNNVYLLNNNTITIDTLAETARIGITTATTPTAGAPVPFATGATGDLDYAKIFTPDAADQGYVVNKDGSGNLFLSAHQHSWTYALKEGTTDTIIATCTADGCANRDGGSVMISASDAAYDRSAKAATVTAIGDWKGDAVDSIAVKYTGREGTVYDSADAPTNAGKYTGSITLGSATASVAYEITKVAPKIASWLPYTGPLPAYNGEQVKNPTSLPMTFGEFADITGFKWYQATKNEGSSYTKGEELSTPPTDAGDYYIEAIFKEGTNTTAGIEGTGLTVKPMQTEKVVNAKEYPVYANRAYTYEIDLNSYLTDLHLGTGVTYTKTNGDLPDYFKAGELSISSDGKLTVPVKKTTTAPLPSTIATIVVWVKSSNYGRITLSVPIQMVAKKAENLPVSMTGWTYGGTANTPEYTVPDGVTATVTYAAQGSNDFSTTVPTDAGNYTVKVQYETAIEIHTGTANFTIAPKTLTKDDLTYSGPITKVYDTNTNAPGGLTVSVKTGSLVGSDTLPVSGTLKYNSANVNEADQIIFTPTAINTGNYALAATEVLTINGATISKAAQAPLTVTSTSATYGEDLTLTTEGGTGTGAVTYAVTNGTGEATIVDGSKLHPTKAGTVSVTATKAGGDNYEDVTSAAAEITIAKATYGAKNIPVSAKIGSTKMVDLTAWIVPGGSLSYLRKDDNFSVVENPSLDGSIFSFTVRNSEGVVEKVAYAYCQVSSDNYADYVITIKITANAKNKQTGFKFENGSMTKTYGDEDFTLTATGEVKGSTVTYESSAPAVATVDSATGKVTIKGAGTAVITARASATEEYAEAAAACTLTVGKKPIAIPTADATVFTYNGTEQTYALAENEAYTITGNKQTNANETGYSVTAALKDTANTQWADGTAVDKTYTFVIGKAVITVKAKDQTAYVGDKAPTLGEDSYTVSGLVGEEKLTTQPTVKYVGADSSEITPDMTKTGEVKILAGGAAASDNYTIRYEDGKLTVSTRPSGGGGGSRPSTNPVQTEVGKDPDGSVSLSKTSAAKGDKVTITVKPEQHYEVDEVIVRDSKGKQLAVKDNGDGTYTFEMPADKVTVEPTFSWVNPFADVANSAYYVDAVEWMLKREVTQGTTETTFSPNLNCTRAQIVTFLWRAAGSPEPKGTVSFADVSAGSYYAKAVAWAIENGITGGTGNGLFSPDATCTRAQSAAFLYRAAGSPAVNGSAGFSDVAADAYYASAVAWAKEHGITDGIGGGLFGSANDCTRAQIAAFLWRLYAEK